MGRVRRVRGQPGWELVDERYDDGGFTGPNLERPTTLEAELCAIALATAEGGDRGAYHQRQRDKRNQERDRVQKELREVREALGNLERLVLNGPWLAEQLRGFDTVWDKLLPANRLRVRRLIGREAKARQTSSQQLPLPRGPEHDGPQPHLLRRRRPRRGRD